MMKITIEWKDTNGDGTKKVVTDEDQLAVVIAGNLSNATIPKDSDPKMAHASMMLMVPGIADLVATHIIQGAIMLHTAEGAQLIEMHRCNQVAFRRIIDRAMMQPIQKKEGLQWFDLGNVCEGCGRGVLGCRCEGQS